MAEHGTLTRLRVCTDGPSGKACRKCLDAGAEAKRRQRAKNPNANTAAQGIAKVVAMPGSRQSQTAKPNSTSEIGEVEVAVREQCAAAEGRGDNQAGLRAAAIKLARLIDDDDAKGQAGQNIAKLQRLLESLGPPKRKMKGRNSLATVTAMSRNNRRAAQ